MYWVDRKISCLTDRTQNAIDEQWQNRGNISSSTSQIKDFFLQDFY